MAKQQREKASVTPETSGSFQVRQQEGWAVRHSNSISVSECFPESTTQAGRSDMMPNESKPRKGPKPPKTLTGTLVLY